MWLLLLCTIRPPSRLLPRRSSAYHRHPLSESQIKSSKSFTYTYPTNTYPTNYAIKLLSYFRDLPLPIQIFSCYTTKLFSLFFILRLYYFQHIFSSVPGILYLVPLPILIFASYTTKLFLYFSFYGFTTSEVFLAVFPVSCILFLLQHF